MCQVIVANSDKSGDDGFSGSVFTTITTYKFSFASEHTTR